MEKYKIGICDDSQNICAEMEHIIESAMQANGLQAEVLVWYSGESLKEYLCKGGDIDILFLDIELLSFTGIEVADYIRNTLDNRGMQIVYISSHASYAQQLFKTQPLDFLVKPLAKEEVTEALQLGIKLIQRKNEKFQYRIGKDFYQIAYGDIMYFSSRGRTISIMTQDGEKTFYGKLKELEQRLPTDFIAIHQSFVVNKNYIARYTYETVELADGTELSISKAHRKAVRESIL